MKLEIMQGAIIQAMKDLCENATDTVWITDSETMFERLTELFFLADGNKNTLQKIWPEHFEED